MRHEKKLRTDFFREFPAADAQDFEAYKKTFSYHFAMLELSVKDLVSEIKKSLKGKIS